MSYLFVLKDKGTSNQGWWLQLSSADELIDYIKQTNPTRYGKVLENYTYGSEFNENSQTDVPYKSELSLTRAVVESATNGQNIYAAINSFAQMVALRQIRSIEENGCIYINKVGGYHSAYEGEPKYDFICRENLVFPDFKREDIRIKQFPGGEHYYAYIDDVQVRDHDTLKWDTYDEAFQHALSFLDESERTKEDIERD